MSKLWTQAAFVTVRCDTEEEAKRRFQHIDGTLIANDVEVSLDGYPEPIEQEDDE